VPAAVAQKFQNKNQNKTGYLQCLQPLLQELMRRKSEFRNSQKFRCAKIQKKEDSNKQTKNQRPVPAAVAQKLKIQNVAEVPGVL
jgi:hypothetical protein